MNPTPQLVLFDEPTSGLDPITAKTVDAEILKLRDLAGVTAIVVTLLSLLFILMTIFPGLVGL